ADIVYGARRETWKIELTEDAPELSWEVHSEWTADVDLAECRTPGLWFAQRDDWGEPVLLQILDRSLIYSDPGRQSTRSVLVSGGLAATRAITAQKGQTVIAKTYARTSDVDLKLQSTDYLQRGWMLNGWTWIGRSSRGPDQGPVNVAKGDTFVSGQLKIQVQDPTKSGDQLELEPMHHPALLRASRLFRTHANCAAIADARDGRTGNESDGYHAAMVSWMHALAFAFRRDRGGLAGALPWSGRDLFAEQVRGIARSADIEGRLHVGYASDTALDIGSSFVLATVEHLRVTHDKNLASELLESLKDVLDSSVQRALTSGGLLSVNEAPGPHGDGVEPSHVIDYWDWSRRHGAVIYPNLLLLCALRASADLARWLGDWERGVLRDRQADELSERIRSTFWDEETGTFAEAAGSKSMSSHVYTANQYLAVTGGLLDRASAHELVTTVERLRNGLNLGAEGFGPPTNLIDARESMPQFPAAADEIVQFGHTMNGGRLLSWTYFEVGALTATGYSELAWERLDAVLSRFGKTSLLEGVNYWDWRGRPDLARLEPYLADVVLAAAAVPRFFLGIRPDFEIVHVDPRPVSALPGGSVTFDYGGATVTIGVAGWPDRPAVTVTGLNPGALRLYRDGEPMRCAPVTLNGAPAQLDDNGQPMES
ncbi:MAG: hypothetical protein QOD39_3377, partial [Mycobacterium sp.]|nr:hypothetical protein [Mycobacterium sp.]